MPGKNGQKPKRITRLGERVCKDMPEEGRPQSATGKPNHKCVVSEDGKHALSIFRKAYKV